MAAKLAKATSGYSIEAIKASIAESTLNEMQIKAILSKKGLKGEILETTTAELTAITTTNAMTVSEGAATTATVGLGTAIKGLGVSLKNLAVAHPILTAIVAISAAIGVGITLYEKYGNTLENLQKKAKEAKDAYDNTASEINNINNELKTTQDRIKELEGKDSLSFVEQDELEKLKASNDELERELRIKKTIAQQEGKAAAEAAAKAINKQSEEYNGHFAIGDADTALQYAENPYVFDKGNRIDAAQWNINQAKQNNKELEDLYSKRKEIEAKYENDASKFMNDSEWKYNEENINSKKAYIELVEKQASTYISALMDEDDALYDSNGNVIEGQEDLVKKLKALYDDFDDYTNKDDYGNKLIEHLKKAGVSEDVAKDIRKQLSDDEVKKASQLNISPYIDKNATTAVVREAIRKAQTEATQKKVSLTLDYGNDFNDLNSLFTSLEDNAELLSKANKEISETGHISADNIKKINEAFPENKYPEMTKALYKYRAGLIDSTELFAQLEECYKADSESYVESVKSKYDLDENYYEKIKQLYPNLFENLQSLYQGDFDNWKNLAQAKKGVELKLISEIGSAWKKYYSVFQTEDGSYDYADIGFKVDYGADIVDEDEARELENAAMDKYKADAKKFVDGMNKALAEINKISPDITAPSWQELSPDTSKSSSKDSTDAWKEEAEKQIKLLDHYHNMGYLSDEQYYKALNELNEKYYAGQEKYLDDYRSYAEKIYSGLKQAYSDMLNKQKDYMGQAINAVTGYLDDQIDALNDQKDTVEDEYNARIEALESEQDLLDEQKDAIEEQKNAIQEQIDAIDKANEARQKAIDLQKKQYELNRAMNQNTNKVYVNGQMIWQTDDSAITDARNDLEDAKAQDATDKLQDQIDELDKASDALDKQKDALQDQIDSLNDELDKITEGIEKQIDELQKYRDRWAEIPDQFTYVQNQMIASMMLGQDWQQKALSMNEDMLYTFGTSYNNIQGQLQLVTDASAQDIVNMAQLSGEQLGILAAQADESLTEMGGSIQGQSEISEEALNQLMLAGTDSLSTLASKVGESSQSVCTSIGDIITKAAEAITTLNQLSELQDKMDFAPIYSGVTVTAMRNGGVVEVETARKGTVTGSHRSKIAKSLGEDHLVVAREGEGFVPPEQVKDVQDSVKAVNKFADLLVDKNWAEKYISQAYIPRLSNLKTDTLSASTSTTSQNNTINIESGAIVLNEVTKPDVVGEAIIKELPNYVTRKLNQR